LIFRIKKIVLTSSGMDGIKSKLMRLLNGCWNAPHPSRRVKSTFPITVSSQLELTVLPPRVFERTLYFERQMRKADVFLISTHSTTLCQVNAVRTQFAAEWLPPVEAGDLWPESSSEHHAASTSFIH
jgi:hypothetical protein